VVLAGIIIISSMKTHSSALMMEAARTSETLVNPHQNARRCKPHVGHFQTRRRETTKSYLNLFVPLKAGYFVTN
jgi:hypothetical protein